MIDKKEKKDCCGCGACAQACPFDAISMKEDEIGFLYPYIDADRCRNCGICDKVCGFTEDNPFLSDGEPKLFAAKHKNETVRAASTSGGAFTALSDYVIQKGGIVFGAAYDKDMCVSHMLAENTAERNKFRSSKYVQSDIKNTYVEAEEYLKKGKLVLFTGTPCQIASLHTFLKKDYENLITMDVVCHGVPSRRLWREFLDLLEKKYHSKIVAVNFRDKRDFGWHRPQMAYEYEDGKSHSFCGDQSFFQMFNTNLFLRPSCLKCKLISYHRPSDISVADYWGIERFRKDFDDNKGTSMILLNTKKGEALFDNVKSQMEYFETGKEYCWQGRLQGRSTIHSDTDRFWKEYKKHGLKYVLVKYTDYSASIKFMRRVRNKLLRIISRQKV